MYNTPSKAGRSELDLAISSWKQIHPAEDALSDVARSRIVARAADGVARPALRTLFFPLKRLALAGALPLVMLTAMVGYLTLQGLTPAPGLDTTQTPPIFASKLAGEVIFTIANGDRPHNVYLATTPDGFENAPAITTRDGAFRDSLSGGPDLVFYRID